MLLWCFRDWFIDNVVDIFINKRTTAKMMLKGMEKLKSLKELTKALKFVWQLKTSKVIQLSEYFRESGKGEWNKGRTSQIHKTSLSMSLKVFFIPLFLHFQVKFVQFCIEAICAMLQHELE